MFCAALGNSDRIASLSFHGFEAQTRELTKTIDDAKGAIRQIRELAVVAAEALIDLRVNSHALLVGAPGLDEYKEQDEFKAKVIDKRVVPDQGRDGELVARREPFGPMGSGGDLLQHGTEPSL